MENNINESFYIKDVELFTVLASFGVENWYGLSTDIDITGISESSQNEVISSLYQKGFITIEQDEIMLTEDFSSIIKTLINSKTFIYIRRWQKDDPVLLFYLANNSAVCVERSVNDENTLRINNSSIDQVMDLIVNDCIGEDITRINDEYEYKEFSFTDELTEETIKDKNYTAVIEKFSTDTGKMINRLLVKDLDVCYQLIFQNESETIVLNNCKDNKEYVAKLFCD